MRTHQREKYNDFTGIVGRDVGDAGWHLLLLIILQKAAIERDSDFLQDKSVLDLYNSKFHMRNLPLLFAQRYC